MTQGLKIIYTSHLRLRLKLRHIPTILPKEIWLSAAERYFDRMTHHQIAVKTCRVGEKGRRKD